MTEGLLNENRFWLIFIVNVSTVLKVVSWFFFASEFQNHVSSWYLVARNKVPLQLINSRMQHIYNETLVVDVSDQP